MGRQNRPHTPDGRFFVARNRLRRCTDPRLDDGVRRAAIKALMQARLELRVAQTEQETRVLHDRINAAKTTLGEAGPVWWDDGARDESGLAPEMSSYADWWAGLSEADRMAAG